MSLEEQDPLLMWKAIEGYRDELGDEKKKQDAFLRQQACPHCRSRHLTREYLSTYGAGNGVTFVEGELLAQPMLRCTNCATLVNPSSGMVIERGFADAR